MVCGGGASHTLPPGPPSLLRETFPVSKGAASCGKGNEKGAWMLGSRSYSFAHALEFLFLVLRAMHLLSHFAAEAIKACLGEPRFRWALSVSTPFLPSPAASAFSLPQ